MTRILLTLVVSAAFAAACAPAPVANPNAPPGGYHVVRAGETWDSIAAQRRVETGALLALNGVPPEAPLRPGQPLAVPAATLPPLEQPAQAPQAASPAATTPEDTVEVRPAPPSPFSQEWRAAQVTRAKELLTRAKDLIAETRARQGGIVILGAAALLAGFIALQLLLWLGRELVLALAPLARSIGAFGHELVLNVWYAAWWAGLAFYVPGHKAWRLLQPWVEPRARALGRYALEHGTTWSRRGAKWAHAQSRRAAIAARDEAIDALEELALHRPVLRRVSERVQELAYRDSHAMRARVPGDSLLEVWPPPEQQLLAALESGALSIRFAPMLDVTAVTVAALDSTLRWERSDGVSIPDARLAAAIERPGYTRIQRAVLEHALREACGRAASSTDDDTTPVVAVNLGRSQFYDPTLFPTLRQTLQRSGISAGQLEVGVDERAVLADLVAAGEILGRLSELGVRTTIREFGALTGDQLRALGVSGVTIDFWNSRRDERLSRYVAESVRTAHEAGLPVTAARAETPDEVEFARTLNCERLASAPGEGTAALALTLVAGPLPAESESEALVAA